MGNSNSVAEFECQIAVNDYKPIRKLNDKHLGDVTIMKNTKTGEVIFKKEIEIADINKYHRMIEDYSYHISLKHRNIARIYGFRGADKHDLFKDTSHKISIFFEHLPESLETTLQKKRIQLPQTSNKRLFAGASTKAGFFEESELLDIMFQMVNALEYLQQNNVSHGEIRPGSCFFAEDKSLKLVNQRVICFTEPAFNKAKNGDTDIYLTPPAFEAIGRKQPEPLQNKYKSDVFSMGMTFLECATLKKSTHVYDWNNFTVNTNILTGRLEEIKKRYSSTLYEMIKEMVQIEEADRMDFIQLKQHISGEKRLKTTGLNSYRRLLEDDDAFLRDFIMNTEPNKIINSGRRKSVDNSSSTTASRRHSLSKKPALNIESNKVESKEIVSGDTPCVTKPSLTDLGDSYLPTWRDEEYDEGMAKREVNPKIANVKEQDLNRVTEKARVPRLSNMERFMQDKREIVRYETPGLRHMSAERLPRTINKPTQLEQTFGAVSSSIKVKDLLSKGPTTPSQPVQKNNLNNQMIVRENLKVRFAPGNGNSSEEYRYAAPRTLKKEEKNGEFKYDYEEKVALARPQQNEYLTQRLYDGSSGSGSSNSYATKDANTLSKLVQEALEKSRKCREAANNHAEIKFIPKVGPVPPFSSNFSSITTPAFQPSSQYSSKKQLSPGRSKSVDRRPTPVESGHSSTKTTYQEIINPFTVSFKKKSQRISAKNFLFCSA